MKNLLLPVFIFLALSTVAQEIDVSGYVRDKTNGESLIGATVSVFNTNNGVITNNYGFYNLRINKGDSVKLLFRYVGYEAKLINLYITNDTVMSTFLDENTLLDEIVITDYQKIATASQMSKIGLQTKDINNVPVILGETDVIKSIQLLPGIQSGSEGSSGLFVRGGGPDQNLILIDGVPIYNVSHLFGFFSVFNSDAINKVDVYKGGFAARYGGRLSSVIDIHLKEGNNNKISADGSIGLISSKLSIEGPIGQKQKTSFIVSGRRTYIDLLATPIIEKRSDGRESSGYYFYDINAKINHRFSEKDRIYFSLYKGIDSGYGQTKFDFEEESIRGQVIDRFGIKWGNTIAAIRYNHLFSRKHFANFSIYYNQYNFNLNSINRSTVSELDFSESTTSETEYFSGISDLSIKADMDFQPSHIHSIKYGISAIRHNFNPGVSGFNSNDLDTVISNNSTDAVEFFAYIEDDVEFNTFIRANLGLHYSGFSVDDQLYTSLQPRISFRILTEETSSLKFSLVNMTQYIHLLTNSTIGLPTDLWVPSTKLVSPQNSWQLAVGYAKTLESIELSIESYYKKMSNLIEYKEGTSFFDQGTDWQQKITRGDGESYGLEFFVQRKSGKLTGWIGYTLSWSNRRFDELNGGSPFPYKYDRRHDISILTNYQVKPNLDISATWVYGTGNALTLPVATYPSINDDEIRRYSKRNEYRMSAFHRLDLSLNWTKEKRYITNKWSVGIYNAYNRKNPFYIDEGIDASGNKRFYQYSLFPAIPFFKYGFQF